MYSWSILLNKTPLDKVMKCFSLSLNSLSGTTTNITSVLLENHLFQKFPMNVMSSLAARHTEILSLISRFEYHTQPRKNDVRRMSFRATILLNLSVNIMRILVI